MWNPFRVPPILAFIVVLVLSCRQTKRDSPATANTELALYASDTALVQAFNWAKNKALSYAHDGADPVGPWYEAALPNREAFCMRDVSHQAIGAGILGLNKHNFNMLHKFAQNISAEKDYCSYWEINRYDLPAPVDYENDKDFWYNLPANFDVIYAAQRLFKWTGDQRYVHHPAFRNFYQLSLNEYVDHWDLGYQVVRGRDRSLHGKENGESRFGKNRGIPTYNEGGRGATRLGIDMTASLIAAYRGYAELLTHTEDSIQSVAYLNRAAEEQLFLDNFWWDQDAQAYRSIWYEDETFDYFMVGDKQAFLHYLYYFDVLADQAKVERLITDYRLNFDKLIVELKSYLPIMFYENGHTAIANQMIVDLCSADNPRRDYPENSFTIIEHLTRGLMGINVNAAEHMVSTLSRLDKKEDWVEIKHISLLSNLVTVKHNGLNRSTFRNVSGPTLGWRAQLAGEHDFLYINGKKTSGLHGNKHGQAYTYCTLLVNPGDEFTVAIEN